MLKRVIDGIRSAWLRWKFPVMFVESPGPAVIKLHVGEDPDAGCYYLGGDHIPGKLTGRQLMDRMARRDWVQDIIDFHDAIDSRHIGRIPAMVDHETRDLKARLVKEEFGELMDAIFQKEDLASIAHEGTDLLYVVLGLLLSYGVDPRVTWPEIHAANLRKAGGPRREDGKRLKPPGWVPADISAVLARQLPIERGCAA